MFDLIEECVDLQVAEKNYKFLKKHKNVRKLFLYGGAGSSKSWQIAIWFLLEHLFVERKVNLLCTRKTRPAVKASCFQLFQDLLEEWEVPHTTNLTELVIRLENGNKIIGIGLDKVEKKKSYEGINYVWIEEATEIAKRDWIQLNLRCRAANLDAVNQIICSFNPVDVFSWLKEETDRPDSAEQATGHSTYKDNPFLAEDEVRQIEQLEGMDVLFDAIYRKGEWATPTNVIFRNWQIKEISLDQTYYDDILGGLDFGFNTATALLMVGLKDDNVYIARELYGLGWTNSDLIVKMQGFWPMRLSVTADSAEPDRIKELREESFKVAPAKKGPGSVTAGIDWLRARKIFVHPDCVNTIKELKMYSYIEDKDGRIHDEPVPFEDHAMSALRYAIERWRRRMVVKAVKSLR